MARMPASIEAEAARAIAERAHQFGDWVEDRLPGRHPQTSAAPAAAAVTIRTSTPGGTVSAFSDTMHAIAQRLEKFDEDALARLEAVQGSDITKELFTVVSGLTHVDPTPEFNAVVTLLKAFVPQQQPVQAEPSFTPAGPQVAGQA